MTPTISLVMPVLNRARLITRALDSAAVQNIEDIEIVVVDGGSNDGTADIAAAHPKARLIRAPGSSIYEALNLGIKAARGTLIGQLNSDDRLPAGALGAVLEAAHNDPAALILRGRARFVAQDLEGTIQVLAAHERRVALPLTVQGVTFGAPAINACFMRAEAYRTLGLYDEDLRIAADRDWLLRAVLARVPVRLIDQPVYEYLVHAGSATIARRASSEAVYAREHLAMLARLLPGPLDPDARRVLISWHAQETLRLLLRGRAEDRVGSVVRSAFRDSPAWPVHALKPMLDFALRRLGVRDAPLA